MDFDESRRLRHREDHRASSPRTEIRRTGYPGTQCRSRPTLSARRSRFSRKIEAPRWFRLVSSWRELIRVSAEKIRTAEDTSAVPVHPRFGSQQRFYPIRTADSVDWLERRSVLDVLRSQAGPSRHKRSLANPQAFSPRRSPIGRSCRTEHRLRRQNDAPKIRATVRILRQFHK